MKIFPILILCAAVSIQAVPRQRAPIFEVENGILVRSGQNSANLGRIVGGVDAEPHSAPHKVSLVRSFDFPSRDVMEI